MVVGSERDRNIRVPQQFRDDFHAVPGAQHRSCDRMPEVVPPAQVDLEFLRDRANIALQGIARIQRNSTPCMEDPLAGIAESLHALQQCRWNWNSAFRIPAFGGVDLAVVHAALHVQNVALEI